MNDWCWEMYEKKLVKESGLRIRFPVSWICMMTIKNNALLSLINWLMISV